jgi:hypothetical protein
MTDQVGNSELEVEKYIKSTSNYDKLWRNVLQKSRKPWNKNKLCGRNTNDYFIY